MDAHATAKLTLHDLYHRYISLKFDLKPTTKANYKYMYNHFVRDTFGTRKLAEGCHRAPRKEGQDTVKTTSSSYSMDFVGLIPENYMKQHSIREGSMKLVEISKHTFPTMKTI